MFGGFKGSFLDNYLIKKINNITNQLTSVSSKADNALPKANISNLQNITEKGNYAMDAVEANPSINGSLANKIDSLNTKLVQSKISVSYNFSLLGAVDKRNRMIAEGNKCMLFIAAYTIASITSDGVLIATFDVKYAPSENVMAVLYKIDNTPFLVDVHSDGGLYFNASRNNLSSGDWLWGEISWYVGG